MKNISKAILLMWAAFIVCLIEPFCPIYADGIEEVASTFILLALALMTDKVIAYLMLALSVGKLVDGQVSPYAYSVGELLWDIACFGGAIFLYIYRKAKPTQQTNGIQD